MSNAKKKIGRGMLAVARLLWEHKYTIGYAMLGFLAGHVLDGVLTVTVPFYGVVRLTGGVLGTLFAVGGGIAGFLRDMEGNMTKVVILRDAL